jgi:probable phosphoglycerate mutase
VSAGAIYLIRHGETLWNVEGRRQGSLDSPLTERGVGQAVAAGRALRAILGDRRDVAVECSPLGRARLTAEIVCRELGWPSAAIAIQPLLAEHRQGDWEGLTAPEVDARFPGARAARERDKWSYRFPGGESYTDVYQRAHSWLAAQSCDAHTVAVTHEMTSRTLMGAYAGYSPGEMLALSHPHGHVVRLCGGAVERGAA